MQNDDTIVRYTAEELEALRRQGAGQTNFDAVKALTEAELEASIDQQEEGEVDWTTLTVELPRPKVAFTMRYDPEVLEWFRKQGPGYQTKINAVLKSYMTSQDPDRR